MQFGARARHQLRLGLHPARKLEDRTNILLDDYISKRWLPGLDQVSRFLGYSFALKDVHTFQRGKERTEEFSKVNTLRKGTWGGSLFSYFQQ